MAKRNEFTSLRQGDDESVMSYMGRFVALLPYAEGSTDSETDRVYYFTEGLLPDVGGFVISTEPKTLQRAYEWSLERESYLATQSPEVRIVRSEARSEEHYIRTRNEGRVDSVTEISEHRAWVQLHHRLLGRHRRSHQCLRSQVIFPNLPGQCSSRRDSLPAEVVDRDRVRDLGRFRLHEREARAKHGTHRILVLVSGADRWAISRGSVHSQKKHNHNSINTRESECIRWLSQTEGHPETLLMILVLARVRGFLAITSYLPTPRLVVRVLTTIF
ncbi:hypothetical protein Sjap_013070 [Stephania japonica]|uniref:Retrotransposon gag domain-containing protein n=1 Tax=Stephania japonica TaxID=461633 RepID=A0AAP0IZ03_9MAGN